MIIRKMTASFGKLNGAELTLTEGLNVVEAPNESGKSTWCAFILAMLYGVDSSERARAGHIPGKTRYAPWSGAPMEGAMDIIHGGREISLRRSTRQASAPMREFSAVYTGTLEAVPGLTGADAGELLTGVSREVLRRSAFIGQGDVAVSGAAELEKRIASVVSSGEEGLSYSQADERLRAWQRKRRFNKKGAIPELEAEMRERRELLERLSDAASEREALSSELSEREGERLKISAQVEQSREEDRRELAGRLEACRESERDWERAQAEAVETAAHRKAELSNDAFGPLSPEDSAELAERDAAEAGRLLELSRRDVAFWPAFVFLFLALGAVVAAIVFTWQLYLLAVALVLGAAWVLTGCELKKRANREAAAKRRDILSKYAAEDESGVYACADTHAQLWHESGRAVKSVDKAASELKRIRAEEKTLETRLLSGEDGPETKALMRRLSELEGRIGYIRARLSELTGGIRALGDPMVIASGLRDAQERKDRLEEQFEAIGLAVDALREADAEIRGRFSPVLGRTAAKYLSRLTGGRYDELTLARDFSAMTRLHGDSVAREAGYLSGGTVDLMYLAVRLAVCELALPKEEPCPLILDDALVNLDPGREKAAMDLIADLAEKRQVILFKCR